MQMQPPVHLQMQILCSLDANAAYAAKRGCKRGCKDANATALLHLSFATAQQQHRCKCSLDANAAMLDACSFCI